jgi:tetratricopeptide (TPR) repeat protein
MDLPQAFFPDVPALLEHSPPRRRGGWFWYAGGVFLLIVMISAFFADRSAGVRVLVDVLSGLAMVGLMVGMGMLTWWTVRAHRAEQAQVEAVEELVQLRRWPEAAQILQGLLARPTRSPATRVQGLIYLGSVLARYHRFEDTIAVYSYLLENVRLDPNAAHALRLGRAMAMVRQDHLVDAHQAISELRREVGDSESAGLALIEIYRDVKTGHPEEAIQIFDARLPALRQQLGHRVGDAYVLVAKAYEMLGRTAEAQTAYDRATLLASAAELSRRYPEVAGLSQKYQPAAMPTEAAA